MSASPLYRMDFANVPEEMEADIYAAIQARWPDWSPSDPNLETVLTQAYARLASENGDLAAQVSMGVLKTYGSSVLGIPIQLGVQSSAYTTWTMIDDAGYTVPAGTKIAMQNAEGDLVAFEVLEDYVLAEGSTATPANDVFVQAIDLGIVGNGLSGDAVLIDALNYVATVTMPNPSSGGAEPEYDDDYLTRLTDELQTIRPGAVIPRDFETLARSNPAVGRAVAIDGWNPADDTTDNEKYIGMVVVDDAGEDLGAEVKADLIAYLSSLKETNFVVAIGSPTYTTIDVSVTITTFEGFDPDTVAAAVTAALNDYLSPANWGQPNFGTDSRAWLNATMVRYLETATVINNVEGVDAVTALTIEGGSADVVLTGTVPLTRPGTITVTVP